MDYKTEIFKLRNNCYTCKECPLGRKVTNGLDPHVFGNGKIPSDIMFVAEAPGEQEVILKKPLVGRAGNFYNTKILEKLKLRRSDIYTTNAVLCRPNNNRNPLLAELETCLNHLDKQVCLISPKLIITMGNIPLYSVCDIPPSGITKLHGKIIKSRKWSNGMIIPVFPLFHPAYCLRGSGLKEIDEDLEKLKKIIK